VNLHKLVLVRPQERQRERDCLTRRVAPRRRGALDKKIDLRNGCRISLCGKITFYFSAGVPLYMKVTEQAKANIQRDRGKNMQVECCPLARGDFDLTSALDFLGCHSGYMCQIPLSGLGICLFCHFKGKKKDESCFYKPTCDILKGLPLVA
jgi:hypothetical protein